MSRLLVRSQLRLVLLAAVALGFGACVLNPQPEPPLDEETGGSANMDPGAGGSGTGSGGVDGGSSIGGSGTGGGGVPAMGGAGAVPTGGMVATGGMDTGGRESTGGTVSSSGGAVATGGSTPGTGGTVDTGTGGTVDTGTGGMHTGGESATGGAVTGGTGGAAAGGMGTGGTTPASGGESATGGMGTGGAGTGGSEAVGGAGGAPTGVCIGAVDAILIDDIADCDATIALDMGRFGEWFAYDSSPELAGNLEPAVGEEFSMAPRSDDNCAARAVGGDYPNSATDGYGYAGIGIALETLSGHLCTGGYDASAYAGLSFSALGPGRVRALVETVATARWGRPNGYAYEFEAGPTWQSHAVIWTELVLLDQASGAPEAIDIGQLRTIRFEPVDPTAFDFWIDDVAFLSAGGGMDGAGGGEGGAGPGGAGGF